MALPPNMTFLSNTNMATPLPTVATNMGQYTDPLHHLDAPPGVAPSGARAVLSTCGGKSELREKVPGRGIIMRSSPKDDRDSMIAVFQEVCPDICKAVSHPIMPSDLHDYFDDYDIHIHGWAFLTEVLRHIATINADRAKEVAVRQTEAQKFANLWIASNEEAFYYLIHPDYAEYGIKDLFTEEDIKDHAEDLLLEAVPLIKHMRQMTYRKCK